MRILIGGEKGGSGKSTLATNLVVALRLAGRDALLLDADGQRTSAKWAERRAASEIVPAVPCTEKRDDLKAVVRELGSRYQDVVVDAGGRDSRELRSALLVADLALFPLRPSQADLETVPHLAELLQLARSLRENGAPLAGLVLSMAPTHYLVSEARDAASMLEALPDFVLAETLIRERKVYRDALLSGRSVLEMDNETAHFEVRQLIKEISNGAIQVPVAQRDPA
ncbi:MAG: putative partition protein (ParA), ATPase [Nevskia sp.]|nr:putative partition protein (ParA), ATPase [Nevskia sp.]